MRSCLAWNLWVAVCIGAVLPPVCSFAQDKAEPTDSLRRRGVVFYLPKLRRDPFTFRKYVKPTLVEETHIGIAWPQELPGPKPGVPNEVERAVPEDTEKTRTGITTTRSHYAPCLRSEVLRPLSIRTVLSNAAE